MTIEDTLGYTFSNKNLLNRALTRKAYANEQKQKANEKQYVLAETLEALIGAIYLDGGYDIAKENIIKWFRI